MEIKTPMIEPLLKYKWLIKMGKIPVELFNKFKIYNDGDIVRFETEIRQTVQFKCDLFKLFDLTEFSIKYLDLSNTEMFETKYIIKGMNFEETGDYGDDGISTVTLKLIISNK